MTRIEHSVNIQAPLERVFDYAAEYVACYARHQLIRCFLWSQLFVSRKDLKLTALTPLPSAISFPR